MNGGNDSSSAVKGDFLKGAADAVPVLLGYFAVSVTFGVAAVSYGFRPWVPVLISLTNYTGSGQALGIQLMAAGTTTVIELLVAMLIINIRYALMSLSLSQRLSPSVRTWQRFVLAFGVTDENFALVLSRRREIGFRYLLGVELCAFAGWLSGTVAGAVLGAFLPQIVLDAFGIALPAMFVAIIIPPCRKSPAAFAVVALSAAMSCAFRFLPFFGWLSDGWIYIICGIAAALFGAALFPVREERDGGAAAKEET